MSIVGTRPPLISETNLYEPRHKVNKMLCRTSESALGTVKTVGSGKY